MNEHTSLNGAKNHIPDLMEFKTNRQALLESINKFPNETTEFHREFSGVKSESMSTTLSKLEKDGIVYSEGAPKKWFAKTETDIKTAPARRKQNRTTGKKSNNSALKDSLGIRNYKTVSEISAETGVVKQNIFSAIYELDKKGEVEHIFRVCRVSNRTVKAYRLCAQTETTPTLPPQKVVNPVKTSAGPAIVSIEILGQKVPVSVAKDLYATLKSIFE